MGAGRLLGGSAILTGSRAGRFLGASAPKAKWPASKTSAAGFINA
jgi:hypothetical protein